MSVPSRVLATYPLCAFLYSQSLRPFLPKGSYGYSARQQLKILLQKRSLAVVGSSDEVYLMDFRFAFLFLTQILTQIAENRLGAERSDLRVWGDFGPQKVWKVLRRSGRRNSPQLITRRSLVQVQPPQPQKHRFPAGKRCFSLPFCNFWGRPHFLDTGLTQTVTQTGQKTCPEAVFPSPGPRVFWRDFGEFTAPPSGPFPWSWPPPSGPPW